MGEIKSTLDLVMEKTSHLSLSKAEWEGQQRAELSRILGGVVQKYQDEIFTLKYLERELNALKNKYAGVSIIDNLKAVIGEKLDFNQDNSKLILLLAKVGKTDPKQLESIFDEYQRKIKRGAEKRMEEKKKTLAEKYLISGSAVVPNLETDEPFKSELEKIQSEYGARLQKEKATLGL